MGSNILALVKKYTVGGVGEVGLWDFGVSQKKKKKNGVGGVGGVGLRCFVGKMLSKISQIYRKTPVLETLFK